MWTLKASCKKQPQRLEDKVRETRATQRLFQGLPGCGATDLGSQGIDNLLINTLKFRRDGEPPEVEVGA